MTDHCGQLVWGNGGPHNTSTKFSLVISFSLLQIFLFFLFFIFCGNWNHEKYMKKVLNTRPSSFLQIFCVLSESAGIIVVVVVVEILEWPKNSFHKAFPKNVNLRGSFVIIIKGTFLLYNQIIITSLFFPKSPISFQNPPILSPHQHFPWTWEPSHFGYCNMKNRIKIRYTLEHKDGNFVRTNSPPSQSQPPSSTPSQPQSTSLSKISPILVLVIILLAVIFFVAGLVHLLLRFFMKRPISPPIFQSNRFGENSLSHSHALQRQLRQPDQPHIPDILPRRGRGRPWGRKSRPLDKGWLEERSPGEQACLPLLPNLNIYICISHATHTLVYTC